METLTRQQLFNICKKHDYIAARYKDGTLVGVNTKIAKLKMFDKIRDSKELIRTNYISYYPIDFQEYISIKAPFRR